MLLLEEISAKPSPWTTREQTAELIWEAKEIRQLLKQAGKKNGRRFSPPPIRLPWPSPEWLLLLAVLLGLPALWYGWAALWSGLTMLLR